MENRKLKIVYLLPGGLFNPGGMERVTINKANYLAEKFGYDVSIVTTEQLGRPVFFAVSAKVHLLHLDIGIYANFGKESYLEKCISRYKKVKQYRRELDKLLHSIRPDVTVSLLGLEIEFLSSLKDGSIKIGELHFPGNFRELMARKLSSRFIPNLVAKIRTHSLKKACGKLSRLIVLTEEEKSSWKKSNVTVIPNFLSSLPEEVSTCLEKKAIAAGRLVEEKGFDMLICVWKLVHEKHPDWQLDIFGQGNQHDILLQRIKESHLESVITLHAPSKEIQREYLAHSMMLFPSRYLEALPMVLLEAMSCGLPIVSFDAPCGPKDIIKEGENGFLIKTGEIEAMSAKICTLIENTELRQTMGQNARKTTLNYSEDKIMKEWLDLFTHYIGISQNNTHT